MRAEECHALPEGGLRSAQTTTRAGVLTTTVCEPCPRERGTTEAGRSTRSSRAESPRALRTESRRGQREQCLRQNTLPRNTLCHGRNSLWSGSARRAEDAADESFDRIRVCRLITTKIICIRKGRDGGQDRIRRDLNLDGLGRSSRLLLVLLTLGTRTARAGHRYLVV